MPRTKGDAITKVKCDCGKEHNLLAGITNPLFWCESTLMELARGDLVRFGSQPPKRKLVINRIRRIRRG